MGRLAAADPTRKDLMKRVTALIQLQHDDERCIPRRIQQIQAWPEYRRNGRERIVEQGYEYFATETDHRWRRRKLIDFKSPRIGELEHQRCNAIAVFGFWIEEHLYFEAVGLPAPSNWPISDPSVSHRQR